MCQRTTCTKCKRPTYTGCGAHIEQVLGDVPPAQRCQCRAQAAKSAPAEGRSWLGNFFRS